MTPPRLLIRLAVFALVFAGLAEGWLRYVTPANESPLYRQDPKTFLYSADPHAGRAGLYTEGRIPHRLAVWHVNDAGWLSPFEYVRRPSGGSLVAVFGDSYIEALGVPPARHLDVDLHADLGGDVPVYAFGMSGWYLEQYVVTERYVRSTYDPSLIVLLVAQGDVSASVKTESQYWYHITPSGSGYREVPPTAVYAVGRKARLAHDSALIRYLRYNCHLQLPFMHGNDVQGAPTDADADASSSPDGAAYRQSLAKVLPAAKYMVGRLCAENPGVPIVFAARGSRYLPVDQVAATPLPPDMEALRRSCDGLPQCHFLDLRMAFSLDWTRHHKRFEAYDGSHFNAYADAVAARAVAGYIDSHGLLASHSSASNATR